MWVFHKRENGMKWTFKKWGIPVLTFSFNEPAIGFIWQVGFCCTQSSNLTAILSLISPAILESYFMHLYIFTMLCCGFKIEYQFLYSKGLESRSPFGNLRGVSSLWKKADIKQLKWDYWVIWGSSLGCCMLI